MAVTPRDYRAEADRHEDHAERCEASAKPFPPGSLLREERQRDAAAHRIAAAVYEYREKWAKHLVGCEKSEALVRDVLDLIIAAGDGVAREGVAPSEAPAPQPQGEAESSLSSRPPSAPPTPKQPHDASLHPRPTRAEVEKLLDVYRRALLRDSGNEADGMRIDAARAALLDAVCEKESK